MASVYLLMSRHKGSACRDLNMQRFLYIKRRIGLAIFYLCSACMSVGRNRCTVDVIDHCYAFEEIQKVSAWTLSKDKLEANPFFTLTDSDCWKKNKLISMLGLRCTTVHPKKVSASPSLRVGVKPWLSWNVSSVKMCCFHHPLPKHSIAKSSQQHRGEMKMDDVWRICQASSGRGDGLSDVVPFYQ